MVAVLGHIDKRHGPAGYAFGTAECAETLGTLTFHGDRCAKRDSQALLDLGLTRRKFRALGDDGYIDIYDRPAHRVQLVHCFGE